MKYDPIKPLWQQREVCLVHGYCSESHSKTGEDYDVIALGVALESVHTPQVGKAKGWADAILCSTYCDHDARTHEVQQQRGSFVMLWADIDKGDHPIDDVVAAVDALVGDCAYAVYSTASAKLGDRRWRVIIPITDAITFDDWRPAQAGLNVCLGRKGIACDEKNLLAGQVCILPLRGAVYEHEARLDGAAFDPFASPMLTEAALEWEEAEAERVRKEAIEDEQRHKSRAAIAKSTGKGPIDRYNASHTVEDLLAAYGYKKGQKGKWKSPYQTSPSAGTSVREGDDKQIWVSFSSSDGAAGLGRADRSGITRWGDAFDLFVHYEHKGDHKAALEALGGKRDKGCGEASTTSTSTFHFVRVGDLKYRPPEFLIEGMLETESLGMVFGDPGSGKSFVAVDLALSIATGTPFHGRAVRQGPVFLIAGEGHNGLTRRFAAWGLHRGVNIETAPLFVSNRPAQFLDADSAATVTEAVRELAAQHGKPALIEIDTLARNYGPGDENSTSDMSAFIAAVDDLKAEFSGCAVALVHHTGHADKKRGRGAMALKGALDWEYLVEKNGEAIVLTNTKMKDAEPPKPVAFALENVTLRDGASSAALRETEAPARITKLKGKDEVAMTALTEALAKHGRTDMGADYPAGVRVVSIDQWRSACAAHGLTSGSSDSAARTAFKRAKDRLIDLDLVRGFNDHFWKVRGDD